MITYSPAICCKLPQFVALCRNPPHFVAKLPQYFATLMNSHVETLLWGRKLLPICRNLMQFSAFHRNLPHFVTKLPQFVEARDCCPLLLPVENNCSPKWGAAISVGPSPPPKNNFFWFLPGHFTLVEGNLLKPGSPYCGPSTAEE